MKQVGFEPRKKRVIDDENGKLIENVVTRQASLGGEVIKQHIHKIKESRHPTTVVNR